MSERHQTVARLIRVVRASLDPERAFTAIAEAASELFEAPGVFFWRADEAARRLELQLVVPAELRAGLPHPAISYEEDLVGWVARHRRMLHVPEVAADERTLAPAWWKEHGFLSSLVVPIVVDEALLGVLSIVARGAYREGDAELAEGLATHAAAALHNAAVLARSETRRQAAEALAEVGRLLSQTLDPETVGQRVTESVCRLLHARSAILYRITDDGSLLGETIYSAADFPWMVRLSSSTGIAGLALRERQPVATSASCRSFADQTAVALENARLYEEAGVRRHEAEELARVAAAITGALDVGTVLPRVLEAARRLTGAELGRLALRDPDRVAGDDARDVQQVADELGLQPRVPLDALERAGAALFVEARPEEQPRPSEDRGERGAELVREHREELVLRAIGGLRLRARRALGLEERGVVRSPTKRSPSRQTFESMSTWTIEPSLHRSRAA